MVTREGVVPPTPVHEAGAVVGTFAGGDEGGVAVVGKSPASPGVVGAAGDPGGGVGVSGLAGVPGVAGGKRSGP